MSTSVRLWLHGLVAAVIGGGAGAVTAGVSASVIDPSHFNFGGELSHTLRLMLGIFVVNGILSAFAYLQKSPVPPEGQ